MATTSSSSGTSGLNTFYESTQRSVQKNLKHIRKNTVILGRMDGWDELAVAAANILPSYARPAFLTGTLGLLSFPVSWGAKGMAADFQEMKDDVQELKNQQVDLALRLLSSDKTPKEIKEKLRAEFANHNANNQRLLDGLNELKDSLNTKIKVIDKETYKETERDKTPTEKANEIKTALKKLDIKYDASDDKIESLLKNDKQQIDDYNIVKNARVLSQNYQEVKKQDKETEAINALKEIADDILEPKRNAYIIQLLDDYHSELDNKAKLKMALDKDDKKSVTELMKELGIQSYENKAQNSPFDLSRFNKATNAEAEVKVETEEGKAKADAEEEKKVTSDIIQYDRNNREIAIEQKPITGYLGSMAMAGMTLGTAVSALKAGTQLLKQFNVSPEFMSTAGTRLERAGSGVFIASQASMVLYGLGEAYKGFQKNKLLEEDKKTLMQSFDMKDGTELTERQSEQLKHIEQLQKYNTQKNTLYGMGIAAAEAGMIAGSLTGSSPLLMASALGTLVFAGLRMVAQSAEANLTGDAHEHDHDGKPIAMLNPWKKPEVERAIDDTGKSKTVICGDANCQTEHGKFELDAEKVKNSYNKLVDYDRKKPIGKSLEDFNEKLNHLNKAEPQGKYMEFVKKMIESRFQEEKDAHSTFTDAVLANPTALENAKETLIDNFENKEGGTHKDDLETLKSKRPDEDVLKDLLENNLTFLDKPQNAKKILKPLLEERIEKLKEKKHSLINNMIHLGMIAHHNESTL
jgi:hypothetical protein